ncbi:RAB6A-GEF complex partner protein 2 [Agrilus planipennis]|uniref:RAB6A-GEF complex partner protein 2 n=1 Tax=Agrilus planipennis TaxID=224129 RepID=A0A1W4WUR7_AGRPL|nr:RAB6A-GEF complex partner protein 2 [Agrilus planipennis]
MLEITVRLIHGPVYLSGETVECTISVTHPLSPSHKVSQSHNDIFESLAWASAQIQCICTTDARVNKKEDNLNYEFALNSTALSTSSEGGQIVVSTKPRILFCDLQLSPGQAKTYVFREKIPSDSPPSYRGQLVKYSYKILIGTQRVNCPVKLLKVPIRVLPVSTSALNELGGFCNDTTEDLAPANPFLEVRQKETPFDITLQTLQNITARRNPNFYMISNTRGKVTRFCLFKPTYKLGEDIIGAFDFTVATVPCVQVSVSLQCEEETNVEQRNIGKLKRSRIITFSKHHEVCLGFKYTQLILPIPLHVTPAFATPLVSLKWRLHFEFVTTMSKTLEGPDLNQAGWQAPTELPIETMVWSLPINLFSTTPAQVAQGLQTNNIQRLIIR